MTNLSTGSKILVLHPGALGDGLLALPCIRKLRRCYPKHEVIWIGHQELGKVFVIAGEVHVAHSFYSFPVGTSSASLSSIRHTLQSTSSCDDLVVGWLNDDDGYWKIRVEHLGYVRSLFRSPHDPQLSSRHMLERYGECIEGGNTTPHSFIESDFRSLKGPFPSYHLPLNSLFQVALEKGELILLHPGSGSPQKCVGTEIFADLAKKLILRFPGKIGIIEGPADSIYFPHLLNSLTDVDFLHLQNVDLLTICGLLPHVQLFIGHDSGLSHLAANCGVQSLLLFGPTDPAVWAPRGPHVRVKRNQQLHFSPDALCDAAEELLHEWSPRFVA